jgi:hypothetical protein
LRAKELDPRRAQVHVNQDFHATGKGQFDLLDTPSGIGKRLADIFFLKIKIRIGGGDPCTTESARIMSGGRALKSTTASALFLKGIEQMSRGLRNPNAKENGDSDSAGDHVSIAALIKKQAEHEERKRRISQAISSGARISRTL